MFGRVCGSTASRLSESRFIKNTITNARKLKKSFVSQEKELVTAYCVYPSRLLDSVAYWTTLFINSVLEGEALCAQKSKYDYHCDMILSCGAGLKRNKFQVVAKYE